jgi:uncharacterized protein
MTGSIISIRRVEIPEEGVQLDLLWDAALLEQLTEQSSRPDIEGSLRLQVRLKTDGPRVVLNGTCEALGTSTCVRCLERFSHPLSLTFRCVFLPVGMESAPENAQLGPGDIDIVFYDGEHIDLIAPVVEQIHLGLPAYPHCSPECKGLCAQCGANLNNGRCTCEAGPRPQSPFAELAKLKKKA